MRPAPESIDAYIASYPPDVAERLQAVRERLRLLLPDAEEAISYQIPCFCMPQGKKRNNVIHFAAFKDHISLFPRSNAIDAELPAVAAYASGKGTMAFPLDQPLPWELIDQIAAIRLREVSASAPPRARPKK